MRVTHEVEEGEDVEAFEGFGKALIIFSQAAKAAHPRERAFHDPPLEQQHKALVGVLHLDEV